jgi:branched-chain amino acid transport system permease protein
MTDNLAALVYPIVPRRDRLLPLGMALFSVAAIYALPGVISNYWLKTFISALALSVGSLSVSLLYAQLGMISLAQYALLGIGGWFALRVAHGAGLPYEVALLGGGCAAAIIGVLVGLPALRMRGLYFAIVTLMTAAAVQVLISAFDFPDGGTGILGKSSGARLMMQRPLLGESDAGFFRYTAVVVALCFLLVYLHTLTRPGRAWAMIRQGEVCAMAGGVNIVAYKIWAFALAGFLAGISGGLLAGGVGQLDGQAFPASQSIMLFALTIVGGAYGWIGPLIAGLLARAVPALLNDWHVDGNIATIIFGAGLLHALTTAPNGAAGQLTELFMTLRRRVLRWMTERAQ